MDKRKTEYFESHPYFYMYRGNGYGFFMTLEDAEANFAIRQRQPKNADYPYATFYKGNPKWTKEINAEGAGGTT